MLASIASPHDLQRLSIEDMTSLAAEIRQFLLQTVSETGGHLGSNLGAVELTLALHYCFSSPHDKIIWDVGHQAYTHKLLTGRRERFHTQRQYKGISGFPKRSESIHDPFGVGHASTSISAGLGMAVAADLDNNNSRVIAVIGDGAMTGGIAFEGLNQSGHLKKNLIVIMNDNEMSISKNVGAFSAFISRKLNNRNYRELKKEMKELFSNIPSIGKDILKFARRAENSLKGFLTPGALFEALGFDYIGPIDGHNLEALTEVFKNARDIEGPLLIHVMTTKGKGYPPAETKPDQFHGVSSFDIATGNAPPKLAAASYTDHFGQALCQIAADNPKVVAITAAMPEGTGLSRFAEMYPERFFDVGIAEQHAVCFAAGLASQGYRPVVAIYSSFMQRAYDQVFHDICLQNLPVTIAMDRAGLVGDDGPTHHGVFDYSFIRHLPGIVCMAPKDEQELRAMLVTAVQHNGPVALRYPRGAGRGLVTETAATALPIGVAEELRSGQAATIIAIGHPVAAAQEAAETLAAQGIDCTVINARFVKPLDHTMLLAAAARGPLITVEENALPGGFGSAVLELLHDNGLHTVPIRRLGIPDRFIEQGPQNQLRHDVGIDHDGIVSAVQQLLGQ